MSISIKDISARTGVSVSTVSRILNGRTQGLRADAARRAERVLAAARDLAYQPNREARSLVLQRSFTIGFFASGMENPVRIKLLGALRELLAARGYTLSTTADHPGRDGWREVLQCNPDGVIAVHVSAPDGAVLSELTARGIPVAELTGRDSAFDSLHVDYRAMFRRLTGHVLESRRRVAFAGFAGEYPQFRGFADALAARRATPFARYGVPDYSMAAGRALAFAHLAHGDRPDAVVCHNDTLAFGLLAGLRELGIRCPDEMAVTGFDNLELAAYCCPALTTAGLREDELAERLARFVLRRLDGEREAPPCRVEVNMKLFLRESTRSVSPQKEVPKCS